MKNTSKRYKKDDLEVIWQPSKCSHAGVCAKSLGEVFNPNRRPWIDLNAGDKNSIVETVQSCPSGALSLARQDQNGSKPEESEAKTSTMSARVIQDGPLLVSGEMVIDLADGKQLIKKNPALCRCGASQNKPFCDGSHTKSGFKG